MEYIYFACLSLLCVATCMYRLAILMRHVTATAAATSSTRSGVSLYNAENYFISHTTAASEQVNGPGNRGRRIKAHTADIFFPFFTSFHL